MKNVELIRTRVVRGQSSELQRLRTFISMADNTNHEAIAALEGDNAQDLLAEITELILARLGHVSVIVGKEPNATGRSTRAAAKALKPPKGALPRADPK